MCHTGVHVQARRINAIRTFTLDAQPWSETLVICQEEQKFRVRVSTFP